MDSAKSNVLAQESWLILTTDTAMINASVDYLPAVAYFHFENCNSSCPRNRETTSDLSDQSTCQDVVFYRFNDCTVYQPKMLTLPWTNFTSSKICPR